MPAPTPAAVNPVVRVLPLLRVAHLDRFFDYSVEEKDSAACQPGVRVRIRFNGALQDAIVIERRERSDFSGSLRYIERVVSGEVVYPPQLARLVEDIARRYGGTRSDVIRTAVPPRHAKAEEADFSTPWEELGTAEEPDLSAWATYAHGQSFVDSILSGAVARAAWQVAPATSWAPPLAALAAKVAIDGGGVLIAVPSQKEVDLLEEALRAHLGSKQITALTHSLGPQARYRRYLSAARGQARVVIGTRSAAFVPIANLRLCAIFDDGDDNLVDNLKPYVHAREVMSTRSAQEGCSLILGGYARTAEVQLLVESGWAHDLVPTPEFLQRQRPQVTAVGTYGINVAREIGTTTAMQGAAFQAARAALSDGKPVLVHVPRKGYMPSLACGSCHAPARCRHCNGPLGFPAAGGHNHDGGAGAVASCSWCGRLAPQLRCIECGSTRVRAIVLGSEATAVELGRAFAPTRVIVSGGNRIIDSVPCAPALVIATPGAEPRVEDGTYGALLILDTSAMLSRQDLRATERALAAWMKAAALVASGSEGGKVVIAADEHLPVVQALGAWNPAGFASLELAARRDVRFPPVVPMAAIDGPDAAVDHFIELLDLPEHAELLGPVPLPVGASVPGDYDAKKYGPPQRLLIRIPPGPRGTLGKAIYQANAHRVGRKDDLPLRIQVDPINIG